MKELTPYGIAGALQPNPDPSAKGLVYLAEDVHAYLAQLKAEHGRLQGVAVGCVHRDTLAMLPDMRGFDGGAKIWPTRKATYDDAYTLIYALSEAKKSA